MKLKHIIIIFIPAIIFAALALFFSVIQYQPDKIVFNDPNKPETLNIVPIFDSDIVLGNLKAPKTIIAFEDIGCTRCKDQLKIFDAMLAKYPNKVKIVLKTLNVTRFPFASEDAHRYLFCAHKQDKVNEFKNTLFESGQLNQDSLNYAANTSNLDTEQLNSCVNGADVHEYVQKNESLAKNLGIESVPTIFIENKVIQEPLTFEGWEALLSLSE